MNSPELRRSTPLSDQSNGGEDMRKRTNSVWSSKINPFSKGKKKHRGSASKKSSHDSTMIVDKAEDDESFALPAQQPQNTELEKLFEEFMVDLDMKPVVRERMRKLGTAQKWVLMQQDATQRKKSK